MLADEWERKIHNLIVRTCRDGVTFEGNFGISGKTLLL